MTVQEMEAITGGYHGDPFALLGPHMVERERKNEWEIRAFLPQAAEAALLLGTSHFPMERTHPGGLFTAASRKRTRRLQIACYRPARHVHEIEDPYRFPTVLSDFDLHLHSEGTNYEGYNSFGCSSGHRERCRRHALRRLGAERAHCQRRGRFQRLGYPPPPHACTHWWRLGNLHARCQSGYGLQIRHQIAFPRL